MSEDWGADFIPNAGGRVKLVEALSVAQHLPADAIALALAQPDRVAPEVLRVLAKAADGGTLAPREDNLLFWGLHVLGAARDTRGWAAFVRLLRRPSDETGTLLGEMSTSTLPRVVAGLFEGDGADLMDAIADPSLDDFVRWALFGALAFLTFDGRIDRESTRGFLVRFDDERLARAGEAWIGWEEAIALLGIADMAGRVEAARRDARLLEDVSDPEWFALTLADAQANPADTTRFAERDLGYIDDLVAELEAALAGDDDAEPIEPLQNPLRHVGRNDPCPCGSGRKFKKCCLAAA